MNRKSPGQAKIDEAEKKAHIRWLKWTLSEILKLTDVAEIHALARSVLEKP